MTDTDQTRYTIYVELDAFPDPEKYPDGIAYRSGVIDQETGEEIDGQGDIATYEEARQLALSTLEFLI